MKTFPILFGLLFFTLSVLANDQRRFDKLTTVSGKTFDQVSVTKVSATEIRFTHANGIAAVPMVDLPPALQKLFGFDPIAANFEMINVQEERRQALIAEEKRKAENAAEIAKQQKEHEAITAIDKKGVKLSLVVRQISDGAATCAAMGFRFVKIDGKKINGKKVAAKKKMNGEYELAEVPTRLIGADPFEAESLVVVHGLEKPVIGQQVVRVVYPYAYNAKGFATDYAISSDMAYGLMKQKSARR